mmetsp:Transcript_6199/g.15050  ORF Transcript_6199/g.15050 Transcript_6199/m.15050 type:complete len:219 (+) Transcript_6199:106-762(+)
MPFFHTRIFIWLLTGLHHNIPKVFLGTLTAAALGDRRGPSDTRLCCHARDDGSGVLHLGISCLVQGVGDPCTVEALVAAHPCLFDLGQALVGSMQDIGNGGNGHVFRNYESLQNRNLFVNTRSSGNADHEGSADGINCRLGFFLRSDCHDDLEIDCTGSLCQLDYIFATRQQFVVQKHRLGTNRRRLGDLDLVDDHVAIDDRNRTRHLVHGTSLFFHK